MSKKVKKTVIRQIEEIATEHKCMFMVDAMLSMCKHSRLRGIDLINVLVAVLVDVIYSTAAKKDPVLFKEMVENIKAKLLAGIKFFAENEEEG